MLTNGDPHRPFGPPSPPVGRGLLDRALAEQPEMFAYGSMEQVGRKFDVNPVALLRFAQEMGFSGYGALQAAVRQDYALHGHAASVGPDTVRRLDGVWSGHRDDIDRLHQGVRASELARA